MTPGTDKPALPDRLDLPDLNERGPNARKAAETRRLVPFMELKEKVLLGAIAILVLAAFVVLGVLVATFPAKTSPETPQTPVTDNTVIRLPVNLEVDPRPPAGGDPAESAAAAAAPDTAPGIDNERLDRFEERLNARFGRLEAALLENDRRLTAINLQLAGLVKKPAPERKRPNRAAGGDRATVKKALPPFKLIAVDMWEEKPVVFVNDGQSDLIERLFLSFTYKSWRFIAADWERQEARFEHTATGQQYVLKANS